MPPSAHPSGGAFVSKCLALIEKPDKKWSFPGEPFQKKKVSGYPFHKHTNMLSMNNLFRWPKKIMIKK